MSDSTAGMSWWEVHHEETPLLTRSFIIYHVSTVVEPCCGINVHMWTKGYNMSKTLEIIVYQRNLFQFTNRSNFKQLFYKLFQKTSTCFSKTHNLNARNIYVIRLLLSKRVCVCELKFTSENEVITSYLSITLHGGLNPK